jgi:hypothetical protein
VKRKQAKEPIVLPLAGNRKGKVINMMLQNQVTAKVRRRTTRIYGPVIVRLYYGNDGFVMSVLIASGRV